MPWPWRRVRRPSGRWTGGSPALTARARDRGPAVVQHDPVVHDLTADDDLAHDALGGRTGGLRRGTGGAPALASSSTGSASAPPASSSAPPERAIGGVPSSRARNEPIGVRPLSRRAMRSSIGA